MPTRHNNLIWRGLAAAALLAVSPAMAWAAEGGEKAPTFNPGDVGQALFAIVIFLVLLLILRKWAWKPVISQLDMRERAIRERLEQSEAREKQAQQLLADYRARLDKADSEATELLNKTRVDAAQARQEIIEAAREEAHKSVQRAGEDIESAKQAALRELRDLTAQLATDMAGRIIRKTLRPEDHRQLLDESLKEIDQQVARKQ